MKKFLHLGLLSLILSIALYALPALADSAFIGGLGNTVKILSNEDIQMKDEVINIDLYKKGEAIYDENSYDFRKGAKIDVLYTFKNLTDKEVTVKMGFPEKCFPPGERDMECYNYHEDTKPEYTLFDFEANEDNKEIPVTFRKDTDAQTLGVNWYIYDVTFKANEEKKIRNTYALIPSSYNSKWIYYILETGASWAGVIEDIKINLNLNEGLEIYDIAGIMPAGFALDEENNKVTWHIKNLEPTKDDNIEVSYFTHGSGDRRWFIGDDIHESSSLPLEKIGEDYAYYSSGSAFDNDINTAWVEGVEGSGIGEWTEAPTNSTYGTSHSVWAKKIDEEKVYSKFKIRPGYAKNDDLFQKNNRPKKIKLTLDSGYEEIFDLEDKNEDQIFTLKESQINTEYFRVTILDIYKGSKFDDTAISEVKLMGLLRERQPSFSDSGGHKYKTAISYIKNQNIVQGYPDGTFGPDKQINRAEFTKIIMNAVYPGEADTKKLKNCFKDISDIEDEWFTPYVCLAQAKNIINGYPDNTFKPDKTVNLAEALKIVLNAYGKKTAESEGDWFKPYMDYAKDHYLSYINDKNAGDPITRAEMAEMIYWVRHY